MKGLKLCCLIVTGAAIGAFAFLVLVSVWTSDPIREVIAIANGNLLAVPSRRLSQQEADFLARLIALGAVLPAEFLLQQISSFYTTVISVLMGVIAAIGALSYVYIRSQSELRAEEAAEKFLNSTAFDVILSRKIEESIHKVLDEGLLSDLEATSETIARLEQELRDVRKMARKAAANIASIDTAEDEGKELELEIPGAYTPT